MIFLKFIDKLIYQRGYNDGWKKGYETGRALHDTNCYLLTEQKKVDIKFEPMSPKDVGEEIIQVNNLD